MQTMHSENVKLSVLRISHALAAFRQTKSKCKRCLLSHCTLIQPECIPCTQRPVGNEWEFINIQGKDKHSVALCIICFTASYFTYRNSGKRNNFSGALAAISSHTLPTKKTPNWFKTAS